MKFSLFCFVLLFDAYFSMTLVNDAYMAKKKFKISNDGEVHDLQSNKKNRISLRSKPVSMHDPQVLILFENCKKIISESSVLKDSKAVHTMEIEFPAMFIKFCNKLIQKKDAAALINHKNHEESSEKRLNTPFKYGKKRDYEVYLNNGDDNNGQYDVNDINNDSIDEEFFQNLETRSVIPFRWG